VLAALAAFVARRPLVWHLHDILAKPSFGDAQIRLVAWLARRFATRIIVPSWAVAEALVTAGGPSSRLKVVANGLDAVPGAIDVADLRRDLRLPSGFIVGVFSRLAPWKGQHVVLQALSALPDAHCIVAGDALFGETDYRAELHRLAETLGVSHRVTFLGHRNDVPRLMRAVDVVVHPSIQPEPFGRTIVEAMLARVPVIAAYGGAVSDILDTGEAGLLVPPGDVQSLVDALRSIGNDPGGISAMTERAHDRARERFGTDAMRRSIDAILRETLEGRP
jgi:glycosyltransferase involved in cell wall biosynthesis